MWEKPLLRSKTRAMLIHMALSALIFVPLLYLILARWYPGALFYTDGGWQGMRIMLLVDMVLGPALTFMIYNAAKSRLALTVDFSFIGIVQVAALAYGAWTIEETRIWTVAYNPVFGSFMAVGRNLYHDQQIPEGGWSRFGDEPQYWVRVRQPTMTELPTVLELADHGHPLESIYMLYQPLAEGREELFKLDVKMPVLVQRHPGIGGKYDQFMREHAGAGTLHFYQLTGSYRSVLIALDEEARYVGYIDIDVNKLKKPG